MNILQKHKMPKLAEVNTIIIKNSGPLKDEFKQGFRGQIILIQVSPKKRKSCPIHVMRLP